MATTKICVVFQTKKLEKLESKNEVKVPIIKLSFPQPRNINKKVDLKIGQFLSSLFHLVNFWLLVVIAKRPFISFSFYSIL